MSRAVIVQALRWDLASVQTTNSERLRVTHDFETICAGVGPAHGPAKMQRATMPDTWGVAILVPDSTP